MMVGICGRSYVKRCHTCRRKKIKCDATYPECVRCSESGLKCPGYKKDMEIIFFDASTRRLCRRSKPVLRARAEGQSQCMQHPDSQKYQHFQLKQQIQRINQGPAKENHPLHASLRAAQNKSALIDFLHSRYLPDSSWIHAASSLSYNSKIAKMLQESLLATAMVLVGTSQIPIGSVPKISKDTCLVIGLKYYDSSLMTLRDCLRKGVSNLDGQQLDISLMTCLSCAVYEAMANKSYRRQIQHLDGVGALLSCCGPENLNSLISRSVYFEYRSIRLSLDLFTRKETFMNSPDWINPSWKATEPLSFTWLQRAIDIGFRIPRVLTSLDRYKMGSKQHDDWVITLLRQQALDIKVELGKWKNCLFENFKPNFSLPQRPSRSTRYPDIDTLKGPAHTSYKFPNWDFGAAFVYYGMMCITLNELLIDLTTSYPDKKATEVKNYIDELADECSEVADDICRALEYFLWDHQAYIARMMILVPFEVAVSFVTRLREAGLGRPEDEPTARQKLRFYDLVRDAIKGAGELPTWED